MLSLIVNAQYEVEAGFVTIERKSFRKVRKGGQLGARETRGSMRRIPYWSREQPTPRGATEGPRVCPEAKETEESWSDISGRLSRLIGIILIYRTVG